MTLVFLVTLRDCSHNMKFQAYFFDLDGTLVNSALDLANAVNRLRQHLDLPNLDTETALSFVGDGATRLIQRALPSGMYEPEHLKLFLRLYEHHLVEHSICYEGIRDFLHQHRNSPLAVISNKPHHLALALLEQLDLLHPFSLILGGDSLSEKKPHPLPILHAARVLNVDPTQCLMIGDHHTDLYSAHAAGCSSCFCHYGFGRAQHAPMTWSVNDANELLTLFP